MFVETILGSPLEVMHVHVSLCLYTEICTHMSLCCRCCCRRCCCRCCCRRLSKTQQHVCVYIYIFSYNSVLEERYIRPRASSPEGNVSEVPHGSLATLPLVLNPLKGPHQGLLKSCGLTWVDVDHPFLACFCLSCFVIVFQRVLGPSWGQRGANLGPFGANLGPPWLEDGAQVGGK